MTITIEDLREIAPQGKAEILSQTVDLFNKHADIAEINTPLRKAHFLSQLAHESDGFKTTKEYGGTKTRYAPWYGRGLIQTTWEENYVEFYQWCLKNGFPDAPNFGTAAHRDKVAQFPWAFLAAVSYWDKRKLNVPADADNVVKVTKIINGGDNGLADRKIYLARAKKVLSIVAKVPTATPKGKSVLDVQNRLIALGYRITATGTTNELTKAAVRFFQKQNGLTPDGIAGPKTLAVLFANVN